MSDLTKTIYEARRTYYIDDDEPSIKNYFFTTKAKAKAKFDELKQDIIEHVFPEGDTIGYEVSSDEREDYTYWEVYGNGEYNNNRITLEIYEHELN